MTKSYNEPAFPVTDTTKHEWCGATLRDYFAAAVVQGICASSPGNHMTNEALAKEAFAIADEMLKVRRTE